MITATTGIRFRFRFVVLIMGCGTCVIFLQVINRVLNRIATKRDAKTSMQIELVYCTGAMRRYDRFVRGGCCSPVMLIAIALRYLNVNHPPWRRAC